MSRRRVPLEALAALVLGFLVATLTRRPQDLASTTPLDAGDPVLQSWVLAWPAHALTTGRSLWDANIFAPLDNSLAFTDSLLGYLPFGLVGEGPADALVRYNLVFLFASALAFAGTWVLVRQLGLGRAAALVAAMAFAFNPWRVSQLGHLQVLSSGGIPLALAMLARGHGVRLRSTGPLRPGWAVAGWATAAWHVSLGFGLGIQLAYLLGVCTLVAGLSALRRIAAGAPWPARRILVADGLGIALFLAVCGAMALPYFQAVKDHPEARRTTAEVSLFSPTTSSLVTAPAESWLWGRASQDLRADVVAVQEKALFPGLVVVVLAVAGLWPGAWSTRRVVVVAGTVVVVAACALGTGGPGGGRYGYLLLYEHAPGYQGIRTPGRLITTAWLGLALLAAHGVTVLRRALPSAVEATAGTAVLGLGLSGLVLMEGLDTAGLAPVPAPPSVAIADLPGPVLVLPSDGNVDQTVMNWSTDRFPSIVNGYSGFTPQLTESLRAAAERLPDPAALEQLRAAGVRTLLVLPARLPGTRHERLDPLLLASLPGVTVEQRNETFIVRL